MKKIFNLKEHQVSFKSEFIAGLTSFFAAVYIIVVNASILSDTGMPLEGQIVATVLASLVGCLLMAFISNSPLILMPGMGVNALFTYTIVKSMGLSYQQALASVVMSGVLFSIIAFTKLSTIISQSIPESLKEAITVGIGLFITFIGLQKSGLIVSDATNLVALGALNSPEVLAFLITLIVTLFLFLREIPGAFLISIIAGTLICFGFNIIDFSQLAFGSIDISSYNKLFFSMDFSKISTLSFWIATFSLTLVLVFENIGLLHGQVNGMLKCENKFKPALKATALSTLCCGLLGTSPSVSTVEGTAGITAGGKTGLTSLITSIFFLVSLLFIPFIKIIPNAAISPILIIIGGLMIKNVENINFADFTEGFPAFLIIVLIPLTYSIVDGIAFGFIAYPIMKFFKKEYKDLSLPMYIMSLLFLVYFILHGINI
ncbi:MAG: NCS2 family permease [Clostridium argentinense]|uniref:NCS2 family permease n=1 Tax=Clostridium faecium TaxID=2762223 RepID=A0ABR8YW34_9CLOT|nr:NCS2 family permease [Clostridium faecium]MBD8048455.1 NCS2 family permease [Clostridium faecium]MBS5823437.1 NCS2 family permease [Clostridium argentinense]MDU1348578.1 NCS2 family permease [Clostridium argentinense]